MSVEACSVRLDVEAIVLIGFHPRMDGDALDEIEKNGGHFSKLGQPVPERTIQPSPSSALSPIAMG